MNIAKLTKAFSPSVIVNDLRTLTLFQSGFLLGMVGVMISLSLYWGDGAIGIAAGITGCVCVFLVNMRKMSNFAWGLINCALYGYVAYTSSYYGDMMLNWLFYLPVQLIGAYMWYDLLQDTTVKAKALTSIKSLTLIVVLTTITVILYSFVLGKLGGALSMVDATTTTLSVLATYFMVKGYREQWLCWIVVNVLSIYMWVVAFTSTGEGVGVLIMWCMFLANSLYGTYTWFKSSKVK